MADTDIVTRLRESDGGYFMRKMFTEAADEIERLREQLRLANIDNFNTTAEAERLRAERDDARRETCYELSGWKQSTHEQEARAEAKRRGWDCFKENA